MQLGPEVMYPAASYGRSVRSCGVLYSDGRRELACLRADCTSDLERPHSPDVVRFTVRACCFTAWKSARMAGLFGHSVRISYAHPQKFRSLIIQ